MRTTPASDSNVFDFNALLHPGTVYQHPRDVVTDPRLSLAEKRAILASWASDAGAVDSQPPLRQPSFAKEPVTFDEIMDALFQLDRLSSTPRGAASIAGGRFKHHGIKGLQPLS